MKARKLFHWYWLNPDGSPRLKPDGSPDNFLGPETPGRLELEHAKKLRRGLEIKTRGRGRPRERSQSAKDQAAATIGLSRLKALELNLAADAILKRLPASCRRKAEAAADLAFQAGQMAERAKRANTLALGLAVKRRLRRQPTPAE